MTNSLLSDAARQQLDELIVRSQQNYKHFIGFPAALDFDYSELLPIANMFLNNLGDPHVDALFKTQTKEFEREVVDFCAELFRAPADDYWGYVTNGSTEASLYALYVAREKFDEPVVYYSEASHYSVPKNIYLLNMESAQIRALPSGEIDYEHLRSLLAEHGDRPAIVIANIGTSMAEAKDNVATIKQMLREFGVPHHIHADAALAGIYTALIKPHHPFDFADGVNSINVSGHKFFGAPMPCGVVLVQKRDKDLLKGALNYTGSTDTTISGSRNGHMPLFLWYTIQRFGLEGLKRRASRAQQVAAYAHKELQEIGWYTWRNPGALTVMLASPPEPVIKKWQLATHEDWSHIICMPGVTKQQIDEFVGDLQAAVQ